MTLKSVAAALCILVAACSSSARAPADSASSASDEQVIATAMNDYVATLKTNDASKIAAWWTDDALYIDRKDPTLRSRAALDSSLRKIFETAQISDVTVETDDIARSGDLAYFIGRYDETLRMQKGDTVHNRGRFAFMWKRQPDGSWKIAGSVGADVPGA